MNKKYSSLITLIYSAFLFAQTYSGPKEDVNSILENAKKFSSYVMASDYEKIADSYTKAAKIFPNGLDILDSRKEIIDYWTLPEGLETSHHQIFPKEVVIQGDTAYDYGYYEGKTKKTDGSEVAWRGKYVIVWKKNNNEWKMYLDIWNGIRKK